MYFCAMSSVFRVREQAEIRLLKWAPSSRVETLIRQWRCDRIEAGISRVLRKCARRSLRGAGSHKPLNGEGLKVGEEEYKW